MSQATLDQLYEAMRSAPGFVAVEKVSTNILRALDGEGASHREVAAYVAEDFALTQKVLRLANSAMYAPFSSNAGSVVSALQIMGSDALLHLVLGTSVVSEEDLQQDVSLSQTLLASELARSACAERASEASVATLMYDLGRQLMSKFLPAQAARVDQEMLAGAEMDTAARSVLGMTLRELGAEVARKWRLPASIVTIIDGTGDATLVGIARFANTASSLIYQGKAEEVQKLVETLDLPGVDKTRLGQLVQQRLESVTPVPPAGPPALPGAALNSLLKTLQAAPPRTAEELSHAMFPALSQTLRVAHCLLLMMTRSGEFRVRFAYGKGIDELRSKFKVSAELRPTAFHAVIRNNVDVAITDVARMSPSSLPEGYQALLPEVRKFIVLPLATQQVYGLFYCDWDTESDIGAEDMTALRQLRNLFLPYLPKPVL